MAKERATDNFTGKEVDPTELRQQLDFTKRAPIQLGTTCGKCHFFKGAAAWGAPCNELGVLESDLPCKKFTLNPRKLGLEEAETVELLRLLSKMEPRVYESMAALLHTARRAVKLKFLPGQTVYLRLLNGDYLSNYIRAIVLSATQKHIVIFGKQNYTGMVLPENLLTADQFKIKKEELTKSKRIVDPKQTISKKENKLLINKESPVFNRSVPVDVDGEVIIKRKRGRPAKHSKDGHNVIKLR